MNALQLKEVFFSKKILCSCFGHKLIVKRNVTPNFKEYECSVCHLELTNDELGSKIILTPQLKEVNQTLFNFYQKKYLHASVA